MSQNYPPSGGGYDSAPPPPPGGDGYGGQPPGGGYGGGQGGGYGGQGGQGGYGAPPPGYGPPAGGNNKKSIWALVLGILSLVCCGLFAGIPAIILGKQAQKEIDASGGLQTGRGMATAGFVLGIISIVFSIIYIILSLTGTIQYNFSTSP